MLEHTFVLTDSQKAAIDKTSDDELRERARLLLAELRADAPRSMKFNANAVKGGGGGEHIEGCGCGIVVQLPSSGSTSPS